MLKVLALSPHTDDAEISCGGTIARFIDNGEEAYCASFSYAARSIPRKFNGDATEEEFNNSMKIFGIPKDRLYSYDYPVRDLPSYRQEILDDMIELRNGINPDIVLLPNSYDIHQDHKTIHEEGIRAFRHSTILGYENLWNSMGMSNYTTYISLDKEHIKKKIKVIGCYKSQLYKKPYMIEFIKNLAYLRGKEIGKEYAEVFETIRWVM